MDGEGANISKLILVAGSLMILLIGAALGAFLLGPDSDPPRVETVSIVSENQPDLFGQCSVLIEAAVTATKVYNGSLGLEDFDAAHGDGTDEGDMPANLGYPTGAAGLQRWLDDVERTMTDPGHDGGLWSSSSDVTIKNHQADPAQNFTILSPGKVVGFDYDNNANGSIEMTDRQAIALMLAQIVDDQPRNPSQLFAALPGGC